MTDQQRFEQIENRLDRLEAIVEANTNTMVDLRIAVSSLIETSNQFQRNFEVMAAEIVSLRRDFTVMQSEIRGLQMENRRILDHLFGQQGNGERGN